MNGRTLAPVALALALSGCSLLSSEDEASPPVTAEPVDEAADQGSDPAQALPVGQPVPMPMAPAAAPGSAAPPEGAAADGPDGVYDIEE